MTCGLCRTAETRDHAYVCDSCGDKATRALRDFADWLEDELENSIHGQQGVQYRAGGGSGGSNDVGLRINWRVAELKARVMSTLFRAAHHCERAGVRNSSPHYGVAKGGIARHAEWLLWRVDGLCLDPEGPRHLGRIVTLAERARNSVDRPGDHTYLGICEACHKGPVYAIPGELMAPCGRCDAEYPAEARRRGLLADLDGRLMTASEIAETARLYLGHPDREKVRKRINQWAKRGKVLAQHGPWLEDQEPTRPRFRFGDVHPLLVIPGPTIAEIVGSRVYLEQWVSPGRGGIATVTTPEEATA